MPYVEGESLARTSAAMGARVCATLLRCSATCSRIAFRAQARRSASRHQARQHFTRGRICNGYRLRRCEALSSSLVHSQRDGRDGAMPHHGHRRLTRHAVVHGAGTGCERSAHRWARRHLFAWHYDHEMLAGDPPFADLPPREMLTARLTQQPPLLSTMRNDIPARLETLIGRCLEADPANRPADAAEVVEWLESSDVSSGHRVSRSAARIRVNARESR